LTDDTPRLAQTSSLISILRRVADIPYFKNDTIQQLVRDAQDALAPGNGAVEAWQPIETAPKDGSKVDLWVTIPARQVTGCGYNRVPDCWFSDGKWWIYDETKYASNAANCRSEVWNVSHWMPIPAAPLPATQGDGE
jgi:GTP:adenosylcobinamide-phosphate guanylyltransferase